MWRVVIIITMDGGQVARVRPWVVISRPADCRRPGPAPNGGSPRDEPHRAPDAAHLPHYDAPLTTHKPALRGQAW
jgi:hypothetical protein